MKNIFTGQNKKTIYVFGVGGMKLVIITCIVLIVLFFYYVLIDNYQI